MALIPGSRLGPYEVLSPLGAGGMGEVWQARDTRLSREVAIKVLPEGLTSDPDRLRRFEKEARSASSLNHPNIVTIHEVGRSVDSVSFIVMELVDGKTLRSVLTAGPLPIRRLLPIATQIVEGIAKAHEAGIVHRDLKPENVMVTKDGHVKILDFGLAKLARPESDSGQTDSALTVSEATLPGIAMGTAGYMSPEQASGHPVDFRSDQFSFGSILYEMVTGKQPFKRATTAQTLAAIIEDDPEPVASVNPSAPLPLRWIVERCQAKEPSGRYASTEDLARDLSRIRDRFAEVSSEAEVDVGLSAFGSRFRRWSIAVGLLLATALGIVVARRPRVEAPRYNRLTFRRGAVWSARFAPDGQAVVFGALWEGRAERIFLGRANSTESTELRLPSADLLSISSSGRMAVLLLRGSEIPLNETTRGLLAEVSLAGGAPREILEDAQGADWSPDGQGLAVIHRVAGRSRLEYPIGKVLYEPAGPGVLACPRFSPDGKSIALFDADRKGAITVVDLSGRRKVVIDGLEFGLGLAGLAWHPKTGEIWFSAREKGAKAGGEAIHSVSSSGAHRVVMRIPSNLILHDISRDGRVLMAQSELSVSLLCLPPGARRETNIGWLDWSHGADISADGTTVLFEERGSSSGVAGEVYIRKTDGSPAVRLGPGRAAALSPDGKWAIVVPVELDRLILMPTGPGEARILGKKGLTHDDARWFPDGKRVLFSASEGPRALRLYVQDVAGGLALPITPEGFNIGPVSPDGKLVASRGPDGGIVLCPVDGGDPSAVRGTEPDDVPIRWDALGEALFVTKGEAVYRARENSPVRIDRLVVSTGHRQLWKEIELADPSGVLGGIDVVLTPDGKTYAYSVSRVLSSLYVVEGLK